MLEGEAPRLFGLPPGADFPGRFARGLLERFACGPPEAMARVEVFLNSGRMRRAVREALAAAERCLLPRLRLVTEAGLEPGPQTPPAAVSPLRRRLELAQLVAGCSRRSRRSRRARRFTIWPTAWRC